MPLTYPMHAEPGELLTTTENIEDIDFNKLWRVPTTWRDGFGETGLSYGDLLLVISCQPEFDIEHGTTKWPTLLFHSRSQRLIYVDDIEDVAWLWRPSSEAVAWKKS